MTSLQVDHTFLSRWVRRPEPQDHKYTRGVVGFATGSLEYPGAALIGVSAALHTGVGMVRYLGPDVVSSMLITSHPEVVIADNQVDAWVVGSGMASPLTEETLARVVATQSSGVPVVLDAGGLDQVENFGPLTILTPHEGELRLVATRLGIPLEGSPVDISLAVAKHLGHSVVVKGSITRVVNKEGSVWELPVATPWLATAGTGDALAGVMGALCAAWHDRIAEQPECLPEIAATAALIHHTAAAYASATAAWDADSPSGGPFSVMDVCRQVSGVIARTLSESS
jgi:ADP-dependent NAD(P)H-hydrate dehydratase / NAD(P)H-hydrate epimerase